MLPQGTLPVNLDYFTSLQKRIDGVASCEELQALTAEAFESINASLAGVTAQLALLEPILALLEAPGANLSSLVTWITTFITSFITPYVRPYTIYAAQLAEISTQLAAVADAITSKSIDFPSCSVTIPATPSLP